MKYLVLHGILLSLLFATPIQGAIQPHGENDVDPDVYKFNKYFISNAEQGGRQGDVTATYYGTSTLLISDGNSNILIDGFFTRPQIELGGDFDTVISEKNYVENRLKLRGFLKSDGSIKIPINNIYTLHSHHDHLLDTANVAFLMDAAVKGNYHATKIIGDYEFGIDEGGNPVVVEVDDVDNGVFSEETNIYGNHDHQDQHDSHKDAINDGDIVHEVYVDGNFNVTFLTSRHQGKADKPWIDGDTDFDEEVWYRRYAAGFNHSLWIQHSGVNILIKSGPLSSFKGTAREMLINEGVDIIFDIVARGTYETLKTEMKLVSEELKPRLIVPIHWDAFYVPELDGIGPLKNNEWLPDGPINFGRFTGIGTLVEGAMEGAIESLADYDDKNPHDRGNVTRLDEYCNEDGIACNWPATNGNSILPQFRMLLPKESISLYQADHGDYSMSLISKLIMYKAAIDNENDVIFINGFE